MRGVDLEVDGLTVDALVGTRHPRCLVLDLSLDVGEISEPPVGDMVEFGPFSPSSGSLRPIGIVQGIGRIIIFGYVDELQDQGSPGADTASSGQEISADDVFQDGRFTSRLRSNHHLPLGQQHEFSIPTGQRELSRSGASPESHCRWC